jgi:hypothetical protein
MFIDDLKGFKTETKPTEVEIKGNFYFLVSLLKRVTRAYLRCVYIRREIVEDRVFFFHATGQIFKIIENLNSYWIKAKRGVA